MSEARKSGAFDYPMRGVIVKKPPSKKQSKPGEGQKPAPKKK